jgi:hypothetical protein
MDAFTLPRQAVHLSFDPGPYRMAMGLVATDPAELIELDERYPEEMAERRRLLAVRHGDVFAALPGSEDARQEVLDVLAELLPRRFPEWFAREGGVLHNRLTGEAWTLDALPHDPLEVAGRLVQEDLCLLRLTELGPVLDAAVLCFPSRWSLAEKLGQPLATIHTRVPFYGERLAKPVDRLMPNLRPGKMVVRLNWGITDDPALYAESRKFRREHNAEVTAANAGERIWLRVERQTLRLLERSGAVLFGIRTHLYPVGLLAGDPRVAADLAAALRGLPAEMALYKSLPPFREALLAYLDAKAEVA